MIWYGHRLVTMPSSSAWSSHNHNALPRSQLQRLTPMLKSYSIVGVDDGNDVHQQVVSPIAAKCRRVTTLSIIVYVCAQY